ncbi:MAG: carbohydrate ABC transporter permease [Mycobacteriales bacterium]
MARVTSRPAESTDATDASDASDASDPTVAAGGAGTHVAAAPSTDVAGLGRKRAVLFVVPALALAGMFLVFPALWTIYIGLLKYSLTGATAAAPVFRGIHNYTDALRDPAFRNALKITIYFVLLSAVIGQSMLGFTIAWRMRTARAWTRGIVQGLVLLAWIMPSTVVVFLWQALLSRNDGTLNALLHTGGTDWALSHPVSVIVVFNIWRGTAFSMLLFAAALGAVPTSQLETARLAGATGMQQLRDVVFPHIRGHILTNTLLISLWTFNDFTPYLLTGGGPDHRSETLPVYVYNVAFRGGDLGFGSAISLIMLVINLIVALFYLRLLRERRAGRAAT